MNLGRDQECESYGFVYVLDSRLGYYKIGKAKYVDNRIEQLKVQLPFPVELLCMFFVLDRHEHERRLHAQLKSKRMNGEWFALTREDLDHFLKVEVLVSDCILSTTHKRYIDASNERAAAGVRSLWDRLPTHVLPSPYGVAQ